SSCNARMTRTAISPRLATSTRLNTRRVYGRRLERSRTGRARRTTSAGLDGVEQPAGEGLKLEEHLPELHRLRVLDRDRAYDGLEICFHLVHQIHRLEESDRIGLADDVALT